MFFWSAAIIYIDMSPITAALIYSPVFAFRSIFGSKAPVLTTIVLAIALSPFLFKIGELPAKIEAQKTHIEKIKTQPIQEKKSGIIY